TRRPPFWRYSAMCFTEYGEFMSTGKVRRLIMMRRCTQLRSAVSRDVTNRQSSSKQTPISSQSHQEVWLGSSSTGPGVSSTVSLNARKPYTRRTNQRRTVLIRARETGAQPQHELPSPVFVYNSVVSLS